MESQSKTASEKSMDQQESEASEVPPKKNPKTAAGSLNPKERTAFYQALVEKRTKRKDL
jgi:hypothetical protein